MVMGEVEIGLIPDTLPPITHMVVVYLCVSMLLLCLFTKIFMATKEAIEVVIMEEVDLRLMRPYTIPFKIIEKVLMVTGEMFIGLRPATIPPIIQVGLVGFWVAMFIVMREVEMGLRPDTLLPINIVENEVPPQGSYKMFLNCSERIKYLKHSSRLLLI